MSFGSHKEVSSTSGCSAEVGVGFHFTSGKLSPGVLLSVPAPTAAALHTAVTATEEAAPVAPKPLCPVTRDLSCSPDL